MLQISLAYAKDRKAFGTTISHFGMIQHKLAEMAIRIYAAESMTYRVEGLIQSHLEGFSWNEPDAARRMMKAVEEFAAECSIIKVYASEMLDYVVDEGVQIHGGYGYHQDYAVERAYRDSRINRIFEGTNEINRLLITGMLLKRAQQGRLGLVKAAKGLMDEVLAGPSAGGGTGFEREENRAAAAGRWRSRNSALELEKQQEVLAGIADVIMETFAMESAQLRSQKNANRSRHLRGAAAGCDGVGSRCSRVRCSRRARKAMRCAPIWPSCGVSRNSNRWIRSRCGGASPNGCSTAGRYVVVR